MYCGVFNMSVAIFGTMKYVIEKKNSGKEEVNRSIDIFGYMT